MQNKCIVTYSIYAQTLRSLYQWVVRLPPYKAWNTVVTGNACWPPFHRPVRRTGRWWPAPASRWVLWYLPEIAIFFHSSTSVTASFPGERGTAPAPVPAAFSEILAQWVMISCEFPLHLCFDPCVVIEVFHGFLIRRWKNCEMAWGKFSNYARCYTKCTEGGNKSW